MAKWRSAERRLSKGGVSAQVFEVDEFEGVNVGGFEDDRRSLSRLKGFCPAGNAEAPVITRIQAGKIVFRDRRGEVIAPLTAESEKSFCHHRANCVQTPVIWPGPAKAIAIKSGDRAVAAGLKWGSEDVGGHGGWGGVFSDQ